MVFWDTSALLKLYVAEPDSNAFAILAQSEEPLTPPLDKLFNYITLWSAPERIVDKRFAAGGYRLYLPTHFVS